MLDMIVSMIPEYAKQIASPLSNIDKITVVDTGGGEGGGANKVTSYATNLMSTLQESLKASSGIDVKEMLENYSGKGNIRPSIDHLAEEVKAANVKQPAPQQQALQKQQLTKQNKLYTKEPRRITRAGLFLNKGLND